MWQMSQVRTTPFTITLCDPLIDQACMPLGERIDILWQGSQLSWIFPSIDADIMTRLARCTEVVESFCCSFSPIPAHPSAAGPLSGVLYVERTQRADTPDTPTSVYHPVLTLPIPQSIHGYLSRGLVHYLLVWLQVEGPTCNHTRQLEVVCLSHWPNGPVT